MVATDMSKTWYKVETSFAKSCSAHPCGALVFRNGLEKWGYRLSNGMIAYRQFNKKQEAILFVESHDPKFLVLISKPTPKPQAFKVIERINEQHIKKTEKIIIKVEKECKQAGLRSARNMKEVILAKPSKSIPFSLMSILDSISGRSAGEFKIACNRASLHLKNIEHPSVISLASTFTPVAPV